MHRFWPCCSHWLALVLVLGSLPAVARGPEAEWVDRYDVVWDTPSGNAAGSMPLGNGDIGINVWTEQDGDLLFYVSKTDAWSEIGRLLKLGRIRIRLTPNPFTSARFVQALRLRHGEIEIRSGEAEQRVHIRIWVDAHQPVVRVELDGRRPFAVQAALEIWRDRPMAFTGEPDRFSAWQVLGPPEEAPDTVWSAGTEHVVWFHRNERSQWALVLPHQGLAEFARQAVDPLLHRTFGGLMGGPGFRRWDERTLTSTTARRQHCLNVVLLTRQTDRPEEYVRTLENLAREIAHADIERQRRAHRRWWAEFWDRSWIQVRVPDSGRAGLKPILPTSLPLRIGADSEGENRLRAVVDQVYIWRRALRPAEIAAHAGGQPPGRDPACVMGWDFEGDSGRALVARTGRRLTARAVDQLELTEGRRGQGVRLNGGYLEVPHDRALDLSDALTVEAWVMPVGELSGRIVDTSRAGTSLGFCLDLFPSNTPRAITAAGTLHASQPLTAGQWAHVAMTFDRGRGEYRLFVNGAEVAATVAPPHDPDELARAWTLQRFLNACGGRGAYPIKFNGSIFTFDMPETWGASPTGGSWQANADYRRWGGAYWFQNTRLTYWPMLAAGDRDLMRPFFCMYLDALPLARARTRAYYGHEGAYFPETMWFWGGYMAEDSGGEQPGEIRNSWIRYYYSGNLELVAMMLDYYQHTQDVEFLNRELLPLANQVLTFYRLHYPYRDRTGRFRLEPSQACETWQKAVNPANEVAGLHWVIEGLLALPEGLVTPEQRVGWLSFAALLPPVPLGTDEQGRAHIKPAEEVLEEKRNVENPELYAVFPFRLYGVGKPDLDTARRTFERRLHRGSAGWSQDEIHAAYLGLAAEAARNLTARMAPSRAYRFPAFWGPNMDWVPDQDHGSVGMMALQAMLLQCEGTRLLLFPAWPREWDVSFKLHAPMNTTVAGVYRQGRLERLVVTPRHRRYDLEVLRPQSITGQAE